ncbi:hypothetical protein JYU13_00105 [Gammaproteobacteria bacterium AH-315-M22]|nr:hypothetical protein [Gammaproteobacteria bacterium AH-315-M22]
MLIFDATIEALIINMRILKMQNAHIFQDSWQIDSKLSYFGITKQELISVAIRAVTSRNDATPFDPINAPGQLSYISGTGAIRAILIPKGDWAIDRTDNVEATFNKKLNVKIIFQNVDHACAKASPKAISGKGSASKRLVENNAGFLWEEMEDEYITQVNTSVWFFCVSVNGDEIRAELSRPSAIEGKQFGEFLERIFIITDDDYNPITDDDTNFDEQDFDIQVTRK